MNANAMELTMDELEMVNGGFNFVAAAIGFVVGAPKGAFVGGALGTAAGPVGTAVGIVVGGAAVGIGEAVAFGYIFDN